MKQLEQKYPGVYYLSGIFNTPSQILVTSELDPELHASLQVLTKRAKEEDVEIFLRMTQGFTEPGEALSLSDRATIDYNVLPSLELIYAARNIRGQ